MKTLQQHLTEAAVQKTPCVYKGKTITYRPGLWGKEWEDYSKLNNFPEEFNYATFKFDYENNLIFVSCPDPDSQSFRHANYRFKVPAGFGKFQSYGTLDPSDLQPYNHRGINITLGLDMMKIACWVFNNSPEPLFDE